MNVICIDDENLMLKNIVQVCNQIPAFRKVSGFSSAKTALEYIKESQETVNMAFIDIEMPIMDGLTLAKEIKLLSAKTVIVFTTAYSEYAFDAYKINALGYLLKPIRKQDIENILKNIDHLKMIDMGNKMVEIRTFGNFEVFVEGKPVLFGRSKPREIFAYIVDRMGTGCSRSEIASVIWEDGVYDRSRQNTLNSYIIDLKQYLVEYGIADVLISGGGRFMINMDIVSCDMYQFLKGDIQAINSYRGEYMSEYPWAEFTMLNLEKKLKSLYENKKTGGGVIKSNK